ncbi:MAG: class I SAM-dependent methyltransferase, partial [Dehalococcoidia bacterium]
MTNGVIEQFGKQAEEYHQSLYHARGKDLEEIVRLAAPGREEVALDLATGAGHAAFAVAQRAGQVIASDITYPMLGRAQKTAQERHITNVEFLLCDAQEIPFSDSSLDLVTCRAAPHHFKHVDRAVGEAFRVVKPGGRVVMVDGAAPEDSELRQFLYRLEKLRDPTHNRRYSLSEWSGMFRSAGFDLEYCQVEDDIYVFDEWMKVAGVAQEVREKLEDMIIHATPQQHSYFRFEIQGNRVVSARNE